MAMAYGNSHRDYDVGYRGRRSLAPLPHGVPSSILNLSLATMSSREESTMPCRTGPGRSVKLKVATTKKQYIGDFLLFPFVDPFVCFHFQCNILFVTENVFLVLLTSG